MSLFSAGTKPVLAGQFEYSDRPIRDRFQSRQATLPVQVTFR